MTSLHDLRDHWYYPCNTTVSGGGLSLLFRGSFLNGVGIPIVILGDPCPVMEVRLAQRNPKPLRSDEQTLSGNLGGEKGWYKVKTTQKTFIEPS